MHGQRNIKSLLRISAFFAYLRRGIRQIKKQHRLITTQTCNCRDTNLHPKYAETCRRLANGLHISISMCCAPVGINTLKKIIAMFTRARRLSLSRVIQTQSTCSNHFLKARFLILSPHLRLGIPRGLSLHFRFPHRNSVFISLLLHACRCSIHLIPFDQIITGIPAFGQEQESRSTSSYKRSFSSYLVPLRHKYSPQLPIPEHNLSVFFPKGDGPAFITRHCVL